MSMRWNHEWDLIWGKGRFADVVKDLEMRSPWIRVALDPMTLS